MQVIDAAAEIQNKLKMLVIAGNIVTFNQLKHS
jgi:hypothetical protein